MSATAHTQILHTNGENRELTCRPELLLIACFLFTMPLFPPNCRYFVSIAPRAIVVDMFMYGLFAASLVFGVLIIINSARRLHWEGFSQRGTVVAATLYLLGFSAFWIEVLVPMVPDVCATVAGVLVGVGMCAILLKWVAAFGRDFRSAILHGGVAFALSLGMSLTRGLLSPVFDAVAWMIIAAIGVFSVLIIRTPDAASFATAHATEQMGLKQVFDVLKTYLAIVWLPALGFFICCIMMSLTSHEIIQPLPTEIIGGMLASALAICVALMQRRHSMVVFVDVIILPVAMAISVVFGCMPAGSPLFFAGMFTILGPLFFVVIYALSAITAAANSGEFPLPLVFGMAFVLGVASLLGGYVLANYTAEFTMGPGSVAWLVIVCYAAVVVVNVSVRFYRHLTKPTGAEPFLPGETRKGGEKFASGAALQDTATRRIAQARGLSEREAEVFEYVARGYGSTYIANALFISPNTARTHVRNIYRKLGVSSRTEILQMIEEL